MYCEKIPFFGEKIQMELNTLLTIIFIDLQPNEKYPFMFYVGYYSLQTKGGEMPSISAMQIIFAETLSLKSPLHSLILDFLQRGYYEF